MGRFHSSRGGGGSRGGRGSSRGWRGGRGRGGMRGRGSFQRGQDFGDSSSSREKIGVLSEETMSYYRNVLQTLNSGFGKDDFDTGEDDKAVSDTDHAGNDDKVEFMNNVFEAIKDEIVQVSQNQTVSWILETLFAQAEPQHLYSLLNPLCQELTLVLFDRFASHVLQSLIEYLPAIYQSLLSMDQDTEEFNVCARKLCQFVESHLRDIMTHTHASHVLRSLLETLGGVKVNDQIVRQKQGKGGSKNKKKQKVTSPLLDISKYPAFSEEYKDWFQTIKDKIIRLCNFEDHMDDLSYSPVLQTVLLILHKGHPEEYANLSSTIVQRTCGDTVGDSDSLDPAQRLPPVVQSEVGSYLFELLLTLANPQQLQDIYTQVFSGRVMYFCVHPHANYVLQSLLAAVTDTTLVQEIQDEISQYFEDILAVNHVGIIIKLAGACQRTGVGQDNFLKLLMTAFHCYEPESRRMKVVPLVASFRTYDVFMGTDQEEQESEKPSPILKDVTIHGSLLLQQLVQFSRPEPICHSLLQLSATELAFMASHQNGSHALDTFCQSDSVKPKHKDSLVKKLVGVYIELAVSRHGSRSLENIWKMCSVQQRILIAEDLCKHVERLESDVFGKFICLNFGLLKFSHRRQEWLQLQGASTKKSQMLKAVLTGSSVSTKKSKKKKKRLEQKENLVSQEGETQATQASTVLETALLDSKHRKKKKKQQKQGTEETAGKNFKKNKRKAMDSDLHIESPRPTDRHDSPTPGKKKKTAPVEQSPVSHVPSDILHAKKKKKAKRKNEK